MPPEDPMITEPPPIDSDGDKLSDQLELLVGTNLLDADTDDDGLTDGYEYFSHRGLDPKVADSDGDLSDDGFELEQGTEPNNNDTDGDNIWDGNDLFPLDETNTFGNPQPATTTVDEGPITSPSQVDAVEEGPITSPSQVDIPEPQAPLPHPNGLEPIDPYADSAYDENIYRDEVAEPYDEAPVDDMVLE
jgi:hypothetical protein